MFQLSNLALFSHLEKNSIHMHGLHTNEENSISYLGAREHSRRIFIQTIFLSPFTIQHMPLKAAKLDEGLIIANRKFSIDIKGLLLTCVKEIGLFCILLKTYRAHTSNISLTIFNV